MRVLIAFDKFKHSMTAQQACAEAARAIREVQPDAQCIEAPLSDGGEGFCEILTQTRGGELSVHRVAGPRFTPLDAKLGMVDIGQLEPDLRSFLNLPDSGKLAIVEMAQASGLDKLSAEERDLWETSTLGTGDLLRLAVEKGATAVLLGIGGSATNDLGLGALEALGLRFRDADEKLVEHLTPSKWPRVRSMEGVPADLPNVRIACDVTNPLLGPNGAAAVYGPQKGLRPDDLSRMQAEMQRMGLMLCQHCRVADAAVDEDSSGAAGGLGFGLRVACGAEYVPGFELVWRWLALQERLESADLVITGEGKFDQSSLDGKGPGTLVRAAMDLDKRVRVFAGAVEEGIVESSGLLQVEAISPRDMPIEQALREAPDRLFRSVRAAASEGF